MACVCVHLSHYKVKHKSSLEVSTGNGNNRSGVSISSWEIFRWNLGKSFCRSVTYGIVPYIILYSNFFTIFMFYGALIESNF